MQFEMKMVSETAVSDQLRGNCQLMRQAMSDAVLLTFRVPESSLSLCLYVQRYGSHTDYTRFIESYAMTASDLPLPSSGKGTSDRAFFKRVWAVSRKHPSALCGPRLHRRID